ncbi:MAG TPA: hypothetical protein VM865_01410, partial [Acidobacteriaceae bacterium]|nr:hypothetical protein [Acidobacteriaceae bacterium]
MRFRMLLALPVLFCAALSARADSLFTFESTSPGTVFPVSSTVNGITLTVAAPGGGAVCNSNGLFSGLSGNVAIQGLCTKDFEGPLTLSFSQVISSLSFNFAVSNEAAPLLVQTMLDGTPGPVGLFFSSLPVGYSNGEGLATLSGSFNSVVLSTDAPFIAVDNDNVAATPTPEPGSLALLGTASLGA